MDFARPMMEIEENFSDDESCTKGKRSLWTAEEVCFNPIKSKFIQA